MRKASALLIFALAALPMLLMLEQAETQDASLFFYDEFEGAAINSTKWNTDIATSGVRWHSSTVENHHSNPGNWEEPGISPPYGHITVANSIVTFRDLDTPSQVFPYIWAGPPSRPSPFPATGDFIIEVRMKYDRISPAGAGLVIVKWANSTPIGNNPPEPAGQAFGIWPQTMNDLNWHTYKLSYVGGEYSWFIDDSLISGPEPSALRPNVIWIGNPVFTHWVSNPWSRPSIDYIRVTIPVLKIFVRDADGNPIVGATVVSTSQPSGQTALSETTDANGLVVCTGILEGSYTIKASKSGYEDEISTVAAVTGQTTTESVTLSEVVATPFPLIWVVAAIILIAVVVIGAYFVMRKTKPTSPETTT